MMTAGGFLDFVRKLDGRFDLAPVVRRCSFVLLLLALSPAAAMAQSAGEYEAWLEWCLSIGTPNYDPSNPVCTPYAGSTGDSMPSPEPVPPTPEEEFWAYLDSARRLIDQGKLDRARDELSEALLLFPNDPEALALQQRLDAATAPAITARAAAGPCGLGAGLPSIEGVESSPAYGEWCKGMQAVANSDWQVALAWFQQALLTDPNNQSLRRAEYMAKFMVGYYAEHGARPIYDPAWEQYEAERLAERSRTETTVENQSALESIGQDPDFLAVRDRIVATWKQADSDAAAVALREMRDRLEALRIQAGLPDWQAFAALEQNDPAFRARIIAERDAVVAQWDAAERTAFETAFQELMSEINRRLAALHGQ